MVKEKTGNSFSDNSNLPKLNFAGLCSLESFSKFLKSGFVVFFFLKFQYRTVLRDPETLKKFYENFFAIFKNKKKVINRWCITISRCNWRTWKSDCKLEPFQSKWKRWKCHFEFDFSTVHAFPSANSVRTKASFISTLTALFWEGIQILNRLRVAWVEILTKITLYKTYKVHLKLKILLMSEILNP